MRKEIDMSLEGNFRMSCLHRHSTAHRPRDISTLITLISVVVAALAPSTAGATAWLIAANIVLAIGIGMAGFTIYSLVAASNKKGTVGPVSQIQNGQLVNTKASNAPLRVIYGIFKVGGNWVFARTSPANINIFNFVVTWGEGEVSGLAPAIDFTPLFSGSGVNDLHTGGAFSFVGCSCDSICYGYSACSCDMTTY
jgi:hypothetical protein